MGYFFPFLEQHMILPDSLAWCFGADGINMIKGHMSLQVIWNPGEILLGWLDVGGCASSQGSGYVR